MREIFLCEYVKKIKSLNTPWPDLKHVTKVKDVGQRQPIPWYCLPKYKKSMLII